MKSPIRYTGLLCVSMLTACSQQGPLTTQLTVSNPETGASLPQLVKLTVPKSIGLHQGSYLSVDGYPVEVTSNTHDELALSILVTVPAGESQTIDLSPTNHELVDQAYAELAVRQNGTWEGTEYKADGFEFSNVSEFTAPEQLTDHSYYLRYEGPGWENDQIGYRLYLDWRNGIDVFAKTGAQISLPEVGQDGYESYHHPADWGLDVLKVGKSLGLGSLGRFEGEQLMHFQNVQQTHWKLLNDNQLSAAFEVRYEGWHVANQSIDVSTVYQINSGDPATEVKVKVSEPVENMVTGLVNHKGTEFITYQGQHWAVIATYGKQSLASEDDELGLALFYQVDEVDQQFTGQYDHLVKFKPLSELTYQFLAVWPQHEESPQNQQEFEAFLQEKLSALDHPVMVKSLDSFRP